MRKCGVPRGMPDAFHYCACSSLACLKLYEGLDFTKVRHMEVNKRQFHNIIQNQKDSLNHILSISFLEGWQAVLDTLQMTVFEQSYVFSAGAMVDTIFCCELRVAGCRLSTNFCTDHENQTKMFQELLVLTRPATC